MSHLTVGADDDLAPALRDGATVTLKPGRYTQRLLLSGRGITLQAQPGAEPVEFWHGGIELCRASHVALRGITFRQSPQTSVAFQEGCADCLLENCAFLACGIKGGGVTVWLGKCCHRLTVRHCRFDMLGARGERHRKPDAHCYDIAIMSDQIDSREHCIEGNLIAQYSYGIQLGTAGTCLEPGRHTVRGNRIEHPWADGIHVKQAQCLIEGNTILGANMNAMSSRAGFANRFVGNHVIDGYMGLVLRGRDHEVRGNRFERCRRAAVLLADAKPNGDGFAADNALVEDNDMVDCGGADFDPLADQPCAGVMVFHDRPQRIGTNRIQGPGLPVVRASREPGAWSLTGRNPQRT